MAQFNFGSNLGAGNANPSGFSFGTPNKVATPTFGSLGTPQTQPAGSITFGTPIASVAPTQNTGLSFGGTPTLGTGLNFGTPASSIAQTNANFGTPSKAPALNFGTPTTQPTLNFGAPATQPTLNFGTPSTQPSLGFGATTTTTSGPGLPFGTPASSAPGLSFGTPASSAPATGGLSFGTPASSAPATGGLSFGAPASGTTGGGGLSFGLTTTSAANPLGGISFGAPTTAAVTTTTSSLGTGGLSFGTPASTANPLGGINFNTPVSSTGFTLGGAVPTTTTPGLNFGAGGSLGTPSFGLGGTATTTGGLNFKGFTSTATTTSTGIALPVTTTVAPLVAAAAPPTTTASTTSVGLGGVDTFQYKATTTGNKDTLAAKQNQVPNEIIQCIENFKQFVKDQKSHSSDVSRGSARPLIKVKEDMDLINNILTDVGNDLQRNQQQADKLKLDSAKCLHNAEMAQRTNDTPPGLQFENTAPLKYFIELVNQFEQDLQALRTQIDVTDKYFQSLHEPRFLSSQELANGMRRIHDTFVALAGRLHSVHTQVESQKEQYLNLRKYILKDPTNIFLKPPSKEEQALDAAIKGLEANKSVCGPTPFSSFGSPFAMNIVTSQQQTEKPPPAYPASSSALNFGSGTSSLGIGNTTQLGATPGLLFGNTSLLGGQSPGAGSSFQLQSPPLGNKRGKR